MKTTAQIAKIGEIGTGKSVKELQDRIRKEQKELNGLYMQKVKFTLKNTSAIRVKRDQIARLFTALRKVQEQ